MDVFGVWRSESEDAGFEVLLVEPGVREMPKDPNVPTIIGELLADDWYNVVSVREFSPKQISCIRGVCATGDGGASREEIMSSDIITRLALETGCQPLGDSIRLLDPDADAGSAEAKIEFPAGVTAGEQLRFGRAVAKPEKGDEGGGAEKSPSPAERAESG